MGCSRRPLGTGPWVHQQIMRSSGHQVIRSSDVRTSEETRMGVIRKTLSVGTLGLVSFRSKKERLRRAERSQRQAEASLLGEQAARIAAESRIAAAEKRVKHASADAAHAAKRLEQSKRRSRRRRKGAIVGEVLAGMEPIVRSGVESARSAGT